MKKIVVMAQSLALALAIGFGTEAGAIPIIENVSAWNGTSQIAGGSFRAVGQTFTVEAPNMAIASFTLYLRQGFVQPFDFRVMEWNGSMATGQVLFAGSAVIDGPTGPDRFTFQIGGVPLTVGKQYVAFADIGPIRDDRTFLGLGITSGPDVGSSYLGGDFVAANFGQDLIGDTWAISPRNGSPSIDSDAVFIARFVEPAPVPEPSTMLLIMTGAVGLAGSKLRRKKP
jgi:hypothetical protein